jgi:hypothetical protein
MRVAVYAVARNAPARLVADWLAASRDANVRCVADLGTADGTADLLRTAGVLVHPLAVAPWRADVALTAALAVVPAEVDVCVRLDLHDRLVPGWRRHVEAGWAGGATRLRHEVVLSWLSPHVPDERARVSAVHARAGYRWRHPAGEELAATGPERVADAGLLVVRAHGVTAPPDLPLLELAAAEDRGPHTLFELGRGYATARRWAESEAVLREYLALPAAADHPERPFAQRLIAAACQHLGRPGEALPWLLRACADDPGGRENWLDLAQLYHDAKDWAGGYHAATRALAIPGGPARHRTFGTAWVERADDLASVCAWYLGLKAEAAAHLRRALDLAPNDARLRANAKFMLT